MKKFFPYGKHYTDQSDANYVASIIKQKNLSQGREIVELETKLSKKIGSKYSLAVSSGTSALYISFLALGLKKNDWIITSPINFVASSNVAELLGANVFFCDINYETGQIDFNQFIESIKYFTLHWSLSKL